MIVASKIILSIGVDMSIHPIGISWIGNSSKRCTGAKSKYCEIREPWQEHHPGGLAKKKKKGTQIVVE